MSLRTFQCKECGELFRDTWGASGYAYINCPTCNSVNIDLLTIKEAKEERTHSSIGRAIDS